jgi:hypothetical protein
MALETWIEGKKYFDRAADVAARSGLESERAALTAKAKTTASGEDKEKPAEKAGEKPGVGR